MTFLRGARTARGLLIAGLTILEANLVRPSNLPEAAMRDGQAAPRADRAPLPKLGWWLPALVLLCLLPRLGIALRQEVICRDGVYYIRLAEALEAHDWPNGFGSTGLNVYPAALVALHGAGLDFPTAGECWGVLLGSLTVLPLFGWVRRLFEDRVALTTALLYAAHPMLIEWSPALVRDPTFWFLWSFSIYALVRAMAEIRLGWFLAAGAATGLAIHTRFEGWLLYLPWCAWACRRMSYLVSDRWRVIGGTLAGFAVYPALLLLVNVTWLHDCPTWELGSFQRIQYVRWWWQGEVAHAHTDNYLRPHERAHDDAITQVAYQTPVNVSSATPHARAFALKYLDALRRGFDLGYALLAGWGMWRWRSLWQRADYWALAVVAAAIFGAIWIHFWYAGATSSRYVLTIVLLALPWTALGCLDLLALLPRRMNYARAWTVAMSALLIVGSARAISGRDKGLEREAALGWWIATELEGNLPLALDKTMPLCAYYGGPARPITWLETRNADWPSFLANDSLRLAIVEELALSPGLASNVAQEWCVVPRERLPESCRKGKFLVLARRGTKLAADVPVENTHSTRKATVER